MTMMQVDVEIEMEKFKCPHCGEKAMEITYVTISEDEFKWTGNMTPEEFKENPDGYIHHERPYRVTTWLLYECGGETGWEVREGRTTAQIDGETQNRCAQLAVR